MSYMITLRAINKIQSRRVEEDLALPNSALLLFLLSFSSPPPASPTPLTPSPSHLGVRIVSACLPKLHYMKSFNKD